MLTKFAKNKSFDLSSDRNYEISLVQQSLFEIKMEPVFDGDLGNFLQNIRLFPFEKFEKLHENLFNFKFFLVSVMAFAKNF